jgi:DNA-binding NarL/FixJ family response regulator
MARHPTENPAPAEALRLLIVDDAPSVRESLECLCKMIPSLKIIGKAGDGVDGLEAIRQYKPDVVTLDIAMPRMNGIEVLKAVREEKHTCKVIMLSCCLEQFYKDQCARLGADYVFDKLSEMEKVIQLLRAMAEDVRKQNQNQVH